LFDRGFTVITGPNGSGKSNVMDSVRFALGELSPKELRCTSFADIIHKTSPQLQSRSAWVSIQFDNSDRRIPVEADAITISREFRRGGEGIYRLNGRRIPRKQLTDILSSADIQVTGYNLIPQHAVTRLAEVSAEERRRIIEDMIGIGIYDLKKQEAQKQLTIADTNLRVASARIEEVRNRVESLERERNDFLRYTFLNREINRLDASLVSRELIGHREALEQLQTRAKAMQERIDEIRRKREELGKRRDLAESKRRQFELEVVDKGSSELFEVERRIGDVNATVARLTAQIESEQTSLRTLEKQKEALQLHADQLLSSSSQMKEEQKNLHRRHQEVLSAVSEKQQQYDALSAKVRLTRERLGENTAKIDEVEQEMENLSKSLGSIDTQIATKTAKIELLENQRHALEVRCSDYLKLIEEMSIRLGEITRLRKEEEGWVKASSNKLEQSQLLLKVKEQEIKEASEIAKKARLSVSELETQKELVETLAPEESALRRIEEIAAAGAIVGVYGRLQNLIEINERCLRAAEAASAGWMTALVVRDTETAIMCAEILKRAKLGRLKIIPANSISPCHPVENCLDIPGVVGRLVDFIECPDEVRPALNFVFGDTIVAEDQKAAFLASIEGLRAVVLTGDLYEPGGGLEAGYFREPFDLASIVPKPSAIENLDQTLHSLETLIGRGEAEILRLTEEVSALKQAEIEGANAIERAGRQIEEIQESFQLAKKSLETTRTRAKAIVNEVEKELEDLSRLKSHQDEIKPKLIRSQKERDSLKLSAKSGQLVQIENELLALTRCLNELKQEQVHIEGRLSTLEKSIETLTSSLDQAHNQSEILCEEIERREKDLDAARQSLDSTNAELKSLVTRREKLASAVSSIRAHREAAETELRMIREDIDKTYAEYESVAQASNQLSAQVREKEAQISACLAKLKDLGYEESVQLNLEEMRRTEGTLDALRRELERIGAVNQLAPQQYDEVVGNYKQLSVRIDELEREKLSIISFMNELDRKKHDAFMNALNQVNRNFQETFSEICSGGQGKLALENAESPFEGGLEMLLQFPGKAELAVSSASGGEKSVAAVCFLLALQTIHQLPFYIFDEIDAHLDALNSQRLAELLKSRSKGSQFIVVSLRDTTISRANKVYGVFVQDGISQVVSLPKVVASN